jgi:hypothetical protein
MASTSGAPGAQWRSEIGVRERRLEQQRLVFSKCG